MGNTYVITGGALDQSNTLNVCLANKSLRLSTRRRPQIALVRVSELFGPSAERQYEFAY